MYIAEFSIPSAVYGEAQCMSLQHQRVSSRAGTTAFSVHNPTSPLPFNTEVLLELEMEHTVVVDITIV